MRTGEKKFKLGDKEVRLVYDWRAIARAKETCGNDVFYNLYSRTPDVVADVLAIGLEKHHPDIGKDQILDLSPPLIPAIKAIDDALAMAYWGPDGPPKKQEGAKAVEKKTL